jgi:hypothetical protein
MIINDYLEMMCKEDVLVYFKALFLSFPELTEKRHENIRIACLRMEIRNRVPSNTKHKFYPLDRDVWLAV